MVKKTAVLLFLVLFLSIQSNAQVQINGTLDVGISSGGSGSAFISNGIPSEYRFLHFSIPQVNLLLFAPINNTWYFEGRLQSDTWGEGTLRMPRFTLANLTYADSEKNYSITAGRFTSPFGFYPSRNLTIDRTFIELPLSYSYYTVISDVYGFWPDGRYVSDYSFENGLMTTVYFGGYNTGLRWDWEIKEDKLHLQTALTAVSPGSARDYSNLRNAALISRLSYNSSIEWQFGVSGSYGSFMHLIESENGDANQSIPLEKFRQALAGFDFRFGRAYWEIIGEVIYSAWKVPIYREGFEFDENNSLETVNYSNIGANLDIKFEPPFLTGSYLAARVDHLNFIEKNPQPIDIYNTNDWDKDKYRYSFAFGYKLARNVEGKFLISEQTPFDTSLYTFRAIITAFF